MQHKFTDIQFMYVEHSKHELHLLDLRQGGSKQQQQDEDNVVDRKLCPSALTACEHQASMLSTQSLTLLVRLSSCSLWSVDS